MATKTREEVKSTEADQQPRKKSNQEQSGKQKNDLQNGNSNQDDRNKGIDSEGSDKNQTEDNDNDKENDKADDKTDEKKKEEKKPVDPATKRRRIIIGAVVGAVALVAALVWYLHSRTYEDTDDAQVDGHLNPIAARIGGTVTAVYVEDEQLVKAGQPLVDLDTRDYEVQVAQARASYEQAVARYEASHPNVPITTVTNRSTLKTDAAGLASAEAAILSAEADYQRNLSRLQQAEANNRKSQADLVRYKKLVDEQEISQSDYDQYVANAGSQQAEVEASKSAAASSAKIVEERKAQLLQQQTKTAQDKANSPEQLAIQRATVDSNKAAVDMAKAQLDTALLNLSYCHIVAPVDGIASQRTAEVGARISEGQQLVVLVQVAGDWITANFKETQLKKMRVGQRVTIKVDSLDESFEGQVQNMPADTGDRASLFPPENATGNYVKVVQRLPVRISLNPNQRDLDRLRPGMSVEPTVHF